MRKLKLHNRQLMALQTASWHGSLAFGQIPNDDIGIFDLLGLA